MIDLLSEASSLRLVRMIASQSCVVHHHRKWSKNEVLKKHRFYHFLKYEFFFDFFKKNLATKKVKNEGFSTPP